MRICGVDIDGSKKLPYGLMKIRGVGINFAKAVIRALGLDADRRIGSLTDAEVKELENAITNPAKYGIPPYLFDRRKDLDTGADLHLIDPDLSLRQKMDIEFMKAIGCWKGIRHALGLKVRGQRTRTTGRTGKTVGVKRKAK